MGVESAATIKEEKRVENQEVRILVVDDEPMMTATSGSLTKRKCYLN